MSIRARRNSLLKSSISIGGIRDSVTKFTDGLFKSNKTAGEIVQKTNDNNNFKRKLIGKDNEFFRKRQENVRRKDREDELEASSVQGITKRTGSLTASSTRGFLGRILDFFGIVLIGWFVTRLPKIIDSIRGLINRVQKLITLLTGFIGSISNFLIEFGTGVGNAIMSIVKFDFKAAEQEASESLDKSFNSLQLMRRRIFDTFNLFTDSRNFGMNDFNQDPLTFGEEETTEKPTAKTEEETGNDKTTNEAQKPKGFMRGLTGAIDFATFGLTDLDKRGDLFGNEEEEKKEEQAPDPNQFRDGSESDREEQKQDDSSLINVDTKDPQSKGETIEKKNIETEQKNEEEKEDAGILAKFNGFMSNMFGTKTKRDEDKEKSSDDLTSIQEKAKELESLSIDLESAVKKLSDNLGKDIKEKSESITPVVRKKQNVGMRKKSSTIFIIEKPVQVGGDNSVAGGMGGGGSSLTIPSNRDRDIMKQIQKVILQR